MTSSTPIDFIFNGDCLDLLKDIADESVDMILTSPPYDNLRGYEGYTFSFESVAEHLARIVKPSGVIVWVVGDAVINGSETGTSFQQALHFKSLGLNLHDTMIFEKNSSTFPAPKTSNRYTQIFEFMFVLSKGKPKAKLICDKENKWAGHKDFSGKLKNPVPTHSARTNIWKYTTSFNGVKHPAPFPLQLAIDHVQTWTEEGDLVLDPFMGSGTTAVACVRLNRHYIGSEISTNYCDLIEKRIIKERNQ